MIDWYIAGAEAYEAGYPIPDSLVEGLTAHEEMQFWQGWETAAHRLQ